MWPKIDVHLALTPHICPSARLCFIRHLQIPQPMGIVAVRASAPRSTHPQVAHAQLGVPQTCDVPIIHLDGTLPWIRWQIQHREGNRLLHQLRNLRLKWRWYLSLLLLLRLRILRLPCLRNFVGFPVGSRSCSRNACCLGFAKSVRRCFPRFISKRSLNGMSGLACYL